MIGIDLVQIQELKKQIEASGVTFLSRAFNAGEIKRDDYEHIAGLWAAKEAVMKAGGLKAGSWLDIKLSHDPDGLPKACVGTTHYEISISHHGDYAIAVALKVAA